MTLISFFDEDPLDNVGDLLYLQPKRCVFLGNDVLMSKRRRRNLEHFVAQRGLGMELQFRALPQGDMERTVCLLRELVTEYPDSILDVSGGTEMFLVAAGIIIGNYDIPAYQRKGKNEQLLWKYGCEPEMRAATLSVREVIELHAGLQVESAAFPRWELTERLKKDVLTLWQLAKEAPVAWNNTCEALAKFCMESMAEDPLQIAVTSQSGRQAFLQLDNAMFVGLMEGGYILEVDLAWNGVTFHFRDESVRRILTKAGNLLELYTCIAADWADDRDIGLPLDWDGKCLDDGSTETRNELDVMLTVGLLPVCISCKNGICTKEALYELETVGRRFGGRYTKKILVATYIHQNELSRRSIEQRANDMKITLIADVDKLTLAEFSQKLWQAVK